jgi:multidrug resistance efflux pump
MARWLASSFALLELVIPAFAADELPKQGPDESFDIEPPLLIPNRSEEPLPEADAPIKLPPNDPDRLEKELDRAKKRAAGAERLFKMGVLSKVEVEQCALRVVRVEADLENARLARVKQEIAQQEKQVAAGEISKADLSETEAMLVHAIEAARAAAAARERAELEAAEANLRRQQKLVSLGIGRKSEVARAEQKVAELKAAKN